MGVQRKVHAAGFQAKVALAAHKADRTVNPLAGQHDVHPTQIHAWKKQRLAGAEAIFVHGAKGAAADAQAREAELYEPIGRLKMEGEWMKKKWPPSAEHKRPLIEVGHPDLSVRRQCAARAEPVEPLLRAGRGPVADAAHRRAVHGPAVLRQPTDDGLARRAR